MLKTDTKNFSVYSTVMRNDATGKVYINSVMISKNRKKIKSSGFVHGAGALSALVAEKFNAGLLSLEEVFDIAANAQKELEKGF